MQPAMDVKLNLMDFGGQRLQMMVHSLFFADKAIYLLVMNQDTQSADIAFWLDNIQGEMCDLQDVRILPIRNPCLHQDTPPLAANLLHQLAPQARQQFHVAQEVTLKISPPADSSDSHDAIAARDKILGTLSYELASFPFRIGFDVHIQIASYIEDNLETLFPEPFYLISVFDQIIKRDDTINRLLADALARAGIDRDQLGRFRKDISVYLDYMGVLTRLEMSQVGEQQKTAGYIIIAPELVQRGLYCVFPPEDDLRDKHSALTAFHNKMTTTDEGQHLPGYFSLDEFTTLVQEALQQAIRQHGDPEEFTADLLEILCQRKLGLIIPLSKGHFLVPAYIEEVRPYEPLTQARQVLNSWSRSQHAYVIELANAQEIIRFPAYFLYKLMVHCRKDHQEAAIQYYGNGVFTDIGSVRTQRCLLRWAHKPSVYTELVGYDGKIWCFGFSEDAEHSGEIDGLIKVVYDGLNRFYHHSSRSTKFSLSRSIPCPKCLTKLTNEAQHNQQAVASRLSQIHLFSDSTLIAMGQHQPRQPVRCANDPLHVFYPSELKKDYLSRHHQSGSRSTVLQEKINRHEVLGYTAVIYEFLHDRGLGTLNDNGSCDALPNLFPGGEIGITEKTMAKMVRWYYRDPDETNPPDPTPCTKAIAHLLNRIPIFRIWAGIKTASQNVANDQYHQHMKTVAQGLQNAPEQFQNDWSRAFPAVTPRNVTTKLRKK